MEIVMEEKAKQYGAFYKALLKEGFDDERAYDILSQLIGQMRI